MVRASGRRVPKGTRKARAPVPGSSHYGREPPGWCWCMRFCWRNQRRAARPTGIVRPTRSVLGARIGAWGLAAGSARALAGAGCAGVGRIGAWAFACAARPAGITAPRTQATRELVQGVLPPLEAADTGRGWTVLVHGLLLARCDRGLLRRGAAREEASQKFGTTDAHRCTPMGQRPPHRHGCASSVVGFRL